MLSSDSFHWLVYGWGHVEMLEEYYMSWFDVPIMVPIISCTVHFFFAWRIWVLARSYLIVGTIILLSLAQGSAGIASGIQLRRLQSFVEVGTLFPAVSVWHGGSALVDIIIAVAMTYLLTRDRNALKDTNDFISRLVRLTVETGILTATVSTVDLVLFNVYKRNNLHMGPAIVLAKLYTNTMMAIFNNRLFASRSRFLGDSHSTGVLTSVELGHSDFQGTWLRDAISQGGRRTVSFQDTFGKIDPVQEVSLGELGDNVERRIDAESLTDIRKEKL
ncbi:hypothetical protein K439DRAFT_326265 [Ramaria rubella]|nr:hypothetical protein K439DRAFT_326265 [Ramaria rubella]